MFAAVRCTLFTYCSRQCLDYATAQAAGRPDPAERAGAQSRPAQLNHITQMCANSHAEVFGQCLALLLMGK